MPVNPLTETKKVDKPKFSLSLNRRNGFLNRLGSKEPQKENTRPLSDANSIQQHKALKRPFSSTYYNTLNAAKKLKAAPLQSAKHTVLYSETELVILEEEESDCEAAMLNGDHQAESQYGNGLTARKTPVATLSNLGNTCFLNSVLYTLRYAPRFLHNLHHLVSELSSVEQKLGSIRLKSSSLGRSAAGLAASATRSWSSKDLLSLGNNEYGGGRSKIQTATEKLHETFSHMRNAETKCYNSAADISPDPVAADAFLTALTHVNSTFEGNRQQDAHELLICILNNIRETCRALSTRAAPLHLHENGDTNGLNRQPSLDSETSKPTLASLRKSWKKRKELKHSERRESPTDAGDAPPNDADKEEKNRPGWDFIAEDFEGTMVMRTRCMECETVNSVGEAICDVCVPLGEDDDPAEPFRAAATAPDMLRDTNKYWCGVCLRYVEARRSVAYSRLPRLLVLQLKRFSGGMQKITRHSPTPTAMSCFCEQCKDAPLQHRYTLWAVIMHLGQTLTGGHYVAYIRDSANVDLKCEREGGCELTSSNNNTSSSFMRTLFNRPRPQPTSGCAAKDCCIPRPRSESCWLSCDDDLVKPITNEEFEDLLSAEPKTRSAATPYLLFYVRSEVNKQPFPPVMGSGWMRKAKDRSWWRSHQEAYVQQWIDKG